MTIKQSNITVNVKDLNRSISFYESIGLSVTNRWGDYYAQLMAPGVVIGLHPTSDNNLKGNSGNTSIGFIADDFEEAKSLLEKLSIKTAEMQEEGGKFILFTDPDGTSLYFTKPNW